MGQDAAFQAVEERLAAQMLADTADGAAEEEWSEDEWELEESLEERPPLRTDAELAGIRMAVAALCGLCALGLCWVFTAKQVQLHWAGFWMLLCCGRAVALSCPPVMGFCWDDFIHLDLIEIMAK